MKETRQVIAFRNSKIDSVLKDNDLSKQERNALFQEYLESDKFKVKPRQKHTKKRKEDMDSDH